MRPAGSKPTTSTNTNPRHPGEEISWGERCFRYVFGVQIPNLRRCDWMFRETTPSAPKNWTTGDQVQVAPKEDYEPLIFLEPVGKLGVFFVCFRREQKGWAVSIREQTCWLIELVDELIELVDFPKGLMSWLELDELVDFIRIFGDESWE